MSIGFKMRVFGTCSMRELRFSRCLILLALISCMRQSKGQRNDEAILISFRSSITSDPKGAFKSWTPDVPYCNWTGITCHPKHPGKVQMIVLSNQSLSGTINPAICQLEHLDYLDLEANNLIGQIPPEIGNCTSLEQLSFSSNSLTGAIPDVLQKMSQLIALAFFSNRLEGPVPPSLGNCTKLQVLSLQTNHLRGPIPDIFYGLRNLSALYLFENNLQGSIPPSIWNCSQMMWLELSTNNLSGNLPQDLEYHALPNVQEISLYTNRLEGRIPKWFANCTSLEMLVLSENRFHGEIPASFGLLPRLRFVILQQNQLFGSIPLGFANSSVLERLVLQGNQLTGIIPVFWFAPNLEYLFLSDNRLTGGIPPSLGNLSSVSVVTLENNELTGSIPTTFGSLQLLERLGLGYNNLNGVIPAASLLRCKRLGLLRLNNNKLEGVIPWELGDIQSLNYLQLGDNDLTGEIPASLGKLSRLQDIYLSGNKLTGKLPESLANLGTSLVNGFDVSFNNLEGEVPPWIGSFDKVSFIALDHNNFTGDIPTTISNCKGLKSLNLSFNALSGEIPAGLAELRSLELLDLSVNRLTGSIPERLSSLTGLQVLNLSFNSLEGQIPSTGVFLEAGNVSVTGNPLLCGVFVQKICYEESKETRHFKWIIPVAITAGVVILVALSLAVVGLGLKEKLFPREMIPNRHLLPLAVFSLEEILRMTNGLSDSNIIGEGAFSKVYRGEIDKTLVAVKVFKRMGIEDKNVFLAEANNLGKLRHRNLTKLTGCCWADNVMALVMEFMPKGSLNNHLHPGVMDRSVGGLELEKKLAIAIDIAQGLNYMHHEFDVPVLHCDLKPDNILLDNDFTAHIADFGISKAVQLGREESSFRGTVGFAPPEYAISAVASTKGDVFSFGVLLLVLTLEIYPTDPMFDELDMRTWVLRNMTELGDEKLSTCMIQVGLLCTQADPQLRPTAREVLAMLLDVRGASTISKLPLDVLATMP